MDEALLKQLERATFASSSALTHSRLKHFAAMAQTSEDHISRIGLGLSIAMGPDPASATIAQVEREPPVSVLKEKQIKGGTLLKHDGIVLLAMMAVLEPCEGYEAWRRLIVAHWERGVQRLAEVAQGATDWLHVMNALEQPSIA
jgi:hypothetical protein